MPETEAHEFSIRPALPNEAATLTEIALAAKRSWGCRSWNSHCRIHALKSDWRIQQQIAKNEQLPARRRLE